MGRPGRASAGRQLRDNRQSSCRHGRVSSPPATGTPASGRSLEPARWRSPTWVAARPARRGSAVGRVSARETREGNSFMGERAGRVEGKVAIVTGAGSTPGPGVGTGKATAVVLAREGAKVVLVDLHAERAEDTRRMIEDEGGEALVFTADATRAADCEAMVQAALDSYGRLDILVNNIGLASVGTVVDTSEEAWDRGFAVNLRNALLACKVQVTRMATLGG